MMKEMGYNLHHDESLNFEKGRRIPLQPFVSKEKPTNYYDLTRRVLGHITPSTQLESKSDEFLPSHSLDSSNWESDVSVLVVFKTFFANMMSISQVEKDEDIKPFDTDSWAK